MKKIIFKQNKKQKSVSLFCNFKKGHGIYSYKSRDILKLDDIVFVLTDKKN